ncbi:MAG: LemA family protein [Sphingomonadaceae bacterium]|uniref:LemA family protein n=1 Tax=Thermaurantiacus sp. TaxID=2820283 RepID=UPI00298EEF36|nr:LemA family protein [Thermaurantiacus sp.]MCS6987185.1 LemA family protein [Sphingomonadaceae bacterium]MDW8415781.1 LemA family protein [Thermaurantiacus sp.]
MRRLVRVVLPAMLALGLSGCGINTVPAKEEAVKAAWAEVQNQYQRRADLIPNLVATVEAFAKQEKDVLVEVTNARARATQVTLSSEQLNDPAAMRRFAEAQGALSQSLGRLLLVVERYPELKSNQNFLALQAQLEGTENRIAVARRDYNRAVQDYNTEIRTFPSIIAAKLIYGAQPKAPFEATTPGAETAPKVKFGA